MRALVICDDYWHPARPCGAGLHHWRMPASSSTGSKTAPTGRGTNERLPGRHPEQIEQRLLDQSGRMDDGGGRNAFLEYVRRGNGLLARSIPGRRAMRRRRRCADYLEAFHPASPSVPGHRNSAGRACPHRLAAFRPRMSTISWRSMTPKPMSSSPPPPNTGRSRAVDPRRRRRTRMCSNAGAQCGGLAEPILPGYP